MEEAPEVYPGFEHNKRYQDEGHATVDEYRIDPPKNQPEPAGPSVP
jgi:hypothetical protein